MKTEIKLGLLLLLLIPCWVVGFRFDVDLPSLHHVARLTAEGGVAAVYTQRDSLGRYFYGPASLPLVSPLGSLPYGAAKGVWLLLQTLSFLVFWFALGRLYPYLRERGVRWAWLLVWILAINPIHNNFQSNNIQLMLAAVLLTAELFTHAPGRVGPWLGGFLVAGTALIKVFPGFLAVFYLICKGRTVRQGVLAGGLFFLLLPLAAFGLSTGLGLYQDFFASIATYGADNPMDKIPDILSLPSLITRWLPPDIYVGAILARIVPVALAVVFFFYVWLHAGPNGDVKGRNEIHLWALACALMIFLNPSTRPHYFIFLVPAFCSVLEISFRQYSSPLAGLGAAVTLVLMAFTAEGVVGKTLNNALEYWGVPTLGMLVLCLVLSREVNRHRAIYVP